MRGKDLQLGFRTDPKEFGFTACKRKQGASRRGIGKNKKRNITDDCSAFIAYALKGRARGEINYLFLFIFDGLHNFCFQLFAEFGVVFKQSLCGVATLT